jgi:hypothetical protein
MVACAEAKDENAGGAKLQGLIIKTRVMQLAFSDEPKLLKRQGMNGEKRKNNPL